MGLLISVPIEVGILSAVALALSLLMLFKSLSGAGLPGCGADSACDAVARSRWSRWLGIPVAALGAAAYLTLLISGMTAQFAAALHAAIAWSIMLVCGLTAAGAAIWFIGLQVLLVRRLCPYCTMLHICGCAAAILILNTVFRGIGAGLIISIPTASLAAGAALAVLVLGQVLVGPRLYVVTPIDPEAPVLSQAAAEPEKVRTGLKTDVQCKSKKTSVPAVVSSETQHPANMHTSPDTAAKRTITVAKGKIALSTADWPIIGSPGAKYIIPKLLDYTCDDCRHMHLLLKTILPRFGGNLAVLVAPVPLNPACNTLVQKLEAKHADACIYARLALAVWVAAPAAFPSFHDQILGSPSVPSVEYAQELANRFVGGSTLSELAESAPVQKRLADGATMLGLVGGGNLPKLILPKNVLWGRVPSADQLAEVLAQQLGLALQASTRS